MREGLQICLHTHLQAQGHVSIECADDNALHRAFQHKVGELVEGAQYANHFPAIAQLWPARLGM